MKTLKFTIKFIVILGILLFIVIEFMINDIPGGGYDSAVRVNMGNFRMFAGEYKNTNGDYRGICTLEDEFVKGTIRALRNAECYDGENGYLLYSEYQEKNKTYKSCVADSEEFGSVMFVDKENMVIDTESFTCSVEE